MSTGLPLRMLGAQRGLPHPLTREPIPRSLHLIRRGLSGGSLRKEPRGRGSGWGTRVDSGSTAPLPHPHFPLRLSSVGLFAGYTPLQETARQRMKRFPELCEPGTLAEPAEGARDPPSTARVADGLPGAGGSDAV